MAQAHAVLYLISKDTPPCPTTSLDIPLPHPPIRINPCWSDCQLEWPHLSSCRWLTLHTPEDSWRHVVLVSDPPQMVRPDMVWLYLSSGREGSVQECLVEGMNISTLI